MQVNKFKFPKLAKLAAQHEKKCDKFMMEQAKFFHEYARLLCQRIRHFIPQFEGCELAMRHLYLEPRDLMLTVIDPDGKEEQERLSNILDGGYLDEDTSNKWKVNLPPSCQDAMRELDELANYIDDNYSMVAELSVKLPRRTATKSLTLYKNSDRTLI